MNLPINFMFSALLATLLTLSHSPVGHARSLPGTVDENSSGGTKNDTTTTVAETQRNKSDAAETKQMEISQPTVVTHILRKKREAEVEMPFDFNTMHLPCDLDLNGRAKLVDSFPNHCIWIWNNKYVNEGFFRVFKTYQLEAFFFGQYYERLKRFEIDPHSWDYGQTGV